MLFICVYTYILYVSYSCVYTDSMKAEDFRKLTKTEQLFYLDCLDETMRFLRWIGEDMHPAADEIGSLIGWFQYVMSDKYEG